MLKLEDQLRVLSSKLNLFFIEQHLPLSVLKAKLG